VQGLAGADQLGDAVEEARDLHDYLRPRIPADVREADRGLANEACVVPLEADSDLIDGKFTACDNTTNACFEVRVQ